LSIRLIQSAFKPGSWKTREDILKLLPGPTVEEVQSLPEGVQDKGSSIYLIIFINFSLL
jgi:hypothetical protein